MNDKDKTINNGAIAATGTASNHTGCRAALAGRVLGLSAVAVLVLSFIWPPVSLIGTAQASPQTDGPWPSFWYGVMSTRNLVRGPNGERIFAEFGADGEVTREFGEAVDRLAGAFVMAGDAYRAQVAAYNQLLAARGGSDAQGAFILSSAAYTATSFTTLSGQPVTRTPALRDATKSVVVRHANAILTPATSPILLESSIDLQNRVTLDAGVRAVLLNVAGQVLEQSATNIGFRAAYVKPKGDGSAGSTGSGDPGNCSPAYGPEQDTRRVRVPGKDAACGPIRGALVTTDVFPGREGGTNTDANGKYLLSYMNLPCPGFDIEYSHYFIPKLYYSVFNPRSSRGLGTYYELHRVYDWCFGSSEVLKNSTTLSGQLAYLNIQGILAAQAVPDKRLDLRIDVLALTGKGRLINGTGQPVPLGDVTEYTTDLPLFTPGNPQALDLDGDRQPDTVIDLSGETPVDPTTKQPLTLPSGTVAVYLGDNTPQRDPDSNALLATWDLTRRSDTQPDLRHQGLLSTLSDADLAETDLYVYRTSNDQLVFSRQGLDPNRDGFLRGQGGGALGDGTAGFFYHSLIRGPVARSSFFGDDFRTWQGKAGMNPDLFERQADHLRVGETIKIIAINRQTGYIGTTTTPVGNAASGSAGEGRIDFPIPDMRLRPPNLKVSVKREYDVTAGLTKGESRNYLVGFEGSGLTTDKTLTLTTEWLDADGTPLPESLPGYTARLAKIVGDRQLSDSLAQFPIQPGRHMQFLRLPGDAVFANDHFYLHVAGEPPEGNPDFSGTGAGTGVLQSRPAHYVPIKVPLLDEVETRRRRNAQRYAKQDALIDPNTAKADAVYAWVYRPEMQFSVLDLAVKALNKTDVDGTVIDLLQDTAAIADFGADDISADVLYDLFLSEYQPLDRLGPPRDWVLALGEDEITAHRGADRTVTFNRLDSLAALAPEDYLSLRLLQNSDAENVLWEFAFGERPGGLPSVGTISADEATLDLLAYLPGAGTASPPVQVTVNWLVDGAGGRVLYPLSRTTSGLLANTLLTSTTAGTVHTVRVRVVDSDNPKFGVGSEQVLGPFTVVAGEPARIDLQWDAARLPADLTSTVTVTATLKDQFGNTVTDGTPVEWLTASQGSVVSADATTVGGVATAVLQAGDTPGTLDLTVRAGTATRQLSLPQDAFAVTVTAARATAEPLGAPVPVSAEFPGVADGAPIRWVSTLGLVVGDSTVQGGTASATFQPGPFEGKTARIYASVGQQSGFGTVALQSQTADPVVFVDDPVLIGDRTVDGNLSVNRLDGKVGPIPYKASTTMRVRGLIPGETYEIDLNGGRNPNLEPIAWYFLDSIEAGKVPDIYHDHPGAIDAPTSASNAVRLDIQTPYRGTGSYRFEAQGRFRIPDAPSLQLTQDFGVSLAVRPDAALSSAAGPIELLRKGTGYGLELVPAGSDYQVRFWVTTASGTQSVTGGATITATTWSHLTAAYRNGALSLEIDGVQTTVVLTEPVVTDTADIVVGGGYLGHLDDLKLFDYSKPRLAGFAGGAQVIALVADANGEIAVPISSLGNLRTASPLDWFIEARVFWQQQQGRVDINARGAFIKFMAFGIAEQLANLMAQVFWDEGQGGSAVVYEFVASTVMLGDIRDILKYGGEWYFGLGDGTAKVSASLGMIGILTTVTPVVDVGVTAAKVVIKAAKGTKAATVVADTGAQIVRELVDFNTTTLTKMRDFFTHFAGSSQSKRFLQDGIIESADDLDRVARLVTAYGDEFDGIIDGILRSADELGAGSQAALDAAKAAIGALDTLGKGIGKIPAGTKLTAEAAEGLVALSKVDAVDAGRLTAMLRHMDDAAELQAGLLSVRRIELLQPRPANYQRVFQELANGLKNKARGALHVLRDVDSPAVGLNNVASFETREVIEFVEGGVAKKVARVIDVVRKDPTRRLEYKAWESGLPSWGSGKKGAEWQFVRDVLNQKSFEWVIKGTDLDKVATKMKQTLGVLKVQGRGDVPKLHPILQEALDAGNITRQEIIDLVTKINNGTLLRAQGY